MEILDKELFEKYRNNSIRIKQMFPNNIGIAEGKPIISFKNWKLFRIFFHMVIIKN